MLRQHVDCRELENFPLCSLDVSFIQALQYGLLALYFLTVVEAFYVPLAAYPSAILSHYFISFITFPLPTSRIYI